MTSELNIIWPVSSEVWRQWLAENHTTDQTIWVACSKKQAKKYTLNHAAAVAEALCYGWIDATTRSFDDEYFLQSFTKRRAKSVWCKANKDKVKELIAGGRMMPPGLAAIETAKQNGYWAILDDVEALKIPHDLQAALHTDLRAEAYFEKICNSEKKRLLQWLVMAKRNETRNKRIAEIVRSCGMELKHKMLSR
ncbi:YdeI family protein [Pedobacter sp. SYP-B3415]|uniref:YdeI/OmpD-associated family protein n=1 Tax=Pedobacter sp. SYP-B3415 TaxID=2496641 RepID=UPI00101D211E|nr:YdeI/OmpD-associated family protein [Pedobacter sp. SYP-B3415]